MQGIFDVFEILRVMLTESLLKINCYDVTYFRKGHFSYMPSTSLPALLLNLHHHYNHDKRGGYAISSDVQWFCSERRVVHIETTKVPVTITP